MLLAEGFPATSSRFSIRGRFGYAISGSRGTAGWWAHATLVFGNRAFSASITSLRGGNLSGVRNFRIFRKALLFSGTFSGSCVATPAAIISSASSGSASDFSTHFMALNVRSCSQR